MASDRARTLLDARSTLGVDELRSLLLVLLEHVSRRLDALDEGGAASIRGPWDLARHAAEADREAHALYLLRELREELAR